jgi:hypothetical protein
MSHDIKTIMVLEGGMTYYKWVDGQLVKLEPEEVGPHFEKFLALPPEEQQKVLDSRPAITWSPEDLDRLKVSLADFATPEAN